MNLITFAESLNLRFVKSSGTGTVVFEAGKDYVIGDAQLERVWTDPIIRKSVYKISKMDNRLRNFHAGVRSGGANRVLVYNGSGGYGDQIMTWPVARILHQMGFIVHVLADPGNQQCWSGFPWVASVLTIPMPAEAFRLFDHYALFDHVVNRDEHGDQPHPVDAMLHRMGIDPAKVAPDLKVIRPNFTEQERAAGRAAVTGSYAIYQLASSSPLRSLPAGDSACLLFQLADAFPELTWLAAYDSLVPAAYREALAKGPDNVKGYAPEQLRELWALTEGARVVVAPDSMLVHVAGSLNVPCVGLWGSTSPASRTCYYQRHKAVHCRHACLHAPCNAYTTEFPAYCPPRLKREICEVMAAISPEAVIQAVQSVITN